MNNSVSNSLNKIRLIESQQLSEAPAAVAPAAKVAGKGLGRFIPGVGAALGAYDAYNRAKQGDWAGAGLSALGGAASLVPGVGTAASVGIAGAQALRDKQRTGSYLPGDDEIAAAAAKDQPAQPATTAAASPAPAAATSKVSPQVMALQKQLIAKGAKIKADGVMGPQTQAAMKQFPDVQLASKENKIKGSIMSESEKIAALRAKLAQLEQSSEQLSEAPLGAAWNALKGAGAAAANAGKNFMRGTAGQAARTPAGTFTKAGGATKAGQVAGKATQAVKANPAKAAAVGGAAAGAAGMAALGGGAATKPAATKPAATKPAAATATTLTPQEEGEMGVLAQEFDKMMGQDPALDALILQYQKIRPGAASAAP
jgi:peptidoglycan hydrolase-like protein with peptidoglycan-binding domain